MNDAQAQVEAIASAIRLLSGKLKAARARADKQMSIGLTNRKKGISDPLANELSKRVASEWKAASRQVASLILQLTNVPHPAAHGLAQRFAYELKRDLGTDLTRKLHPNSNIAL